MIHQLRDMVSGPGAQTGLPGGRWVRAVPLPFYGGLFDRCRDAWAVIRGNAYAVRWPEAGELEDAIGVGMDRPTKGAA
jgi:hypothetical protein